MTRGRVKWTSLFLPQEGEPRVKPIELEFARPHGVNGQKRDDLLVGKSGVTEHLPAAERLFDDEAKTHRNASGLLGDTQKINGGLAGIQKIITDQHARAGR